MDRRGIGVWNGAGPRGPAGADGGRRLSGKGARQFVPRRRRQHRHAHLAPLQDRAALHQLSHRRWQQSRQARPPTARRWEAGPQRHRRQRSTRGERDAPPRVVGCGGAGREDRHAAGDRCRDGRLGAHQCRHNRPDRHATEGDAQRCPPRARRRDSLPPDPDQERRREAARDAPGRWRAGGEKRHRACRRRGRLVGPDGDLGLEGEKPRPRRRQAPRGLCRACVHQGDRHVPRARLARSPLRRGAPRAAPLLPAPRLEQRPQRPRLLCRGIPPLLPAQSLRLGLGQHALGACGEPGSRPLGRARRHPRARRNGADVQRQRRRRLGEHERLRQGGEAGARPPLHRLRQSGRAVPRPQHRRPHVHEIRRQSGRRPIHPRQPRPEGVLARADAAVGDDALCGREGGPHDPLPHLPRSQDLDEPEHDGRVF